MTAIKTIYIPLLKYHLPLFTLLICISSASGQQRTGLSGWLSENALNIGNYPYEQLAGNDSLINYFADKRIIGAGEATHGTSDFQILKYELFKTLVKRYGFRALALEVPNDAVQAANDYIVHSTGDPKAAVKKLTYWTYHTEETLSLLEWIRNHNASVIDSEKVRICGIDISFSVDGERLKDSLVPLKVVSEAMIDSLSMITQLASQLGPISADRWASLDRLASKILHYVQRDEDFRARFGEPYIRNLELSLIGVKQFTSARLLPRRKQNTSYRDSCMASNAIWVSKNLSPNGKLFIGAHNGHIQNSRFESRYYPMGYFLKKQAGDAYYSIGFQFSRGDFSAVLYRPELKRFKGIGKATIEKGTKYSLGELLNATGFGNFFIHFPDPELKTGHPLFYKNAVMRSIGCCYDPKRDAANYQRGIPGELYDG
ncbi:MAG TPA: erythromycin esterase family protein, partial [Sphingobacteriaceae bacterium]